MAQLPPKRPQTITATTQLPQHWPPTEAAAVETQHSPLPHHGHHHNLNHPSWVDEFLDFTSVRRGTHRRSVSDSITFIEAASAISADMPSLVELEINCSSSNNNNSNGANSGSSNNNCYNLGVFDKLDDEQLMSMFSSDDMSLSLPLPTASSNSNPSTPSDQNNNGNIDGEKPNQRDQLVGMANNNNNNNNTSGYGDGGDVVDQSSLCKQEPQNEDSHLPNSSDRDFIVSDPKRVKRILANRQSAQRSRVRKLQYISELERTVTTLQTEVSALSPRVAFLDHQRLILTVDNSAIKQRIAALGQDKIFKDAHQEALKKEIERLRQIYEQQQQQHHQHNSHDGDINGHHHASVSAATPLPQLDIMQQRRVRNEHAAAATLIT